VYALFEVVGLGFLVLHLRPSIEMMMPRTTVVPCLWFLCTILRIDTVAAAAGKMNKDATNNPENSADDDAWRTVIPTSAPIVSGNGKDDSPSPIAVSAPNGNNNTPVNVPIATPAPMDQLNGTGTTEDPEQDTNTDVTDEMKQSCRAVSRGIAVTTNTSIEVMYDFELLTSTAAPLYAGIAVNNVVTNYLIDRYIKQYCNNNRRLLTLQWYRSMQGTITFASGDVRGISRGETTVQEVSCLVPSEDIGRLACHRLQSSNTIHFRDDYVLNTNDISIIKSAETTILTDISSVFGAGKIVDDVVNGGESGLVNVSFISGTSGDVSVQGESRSINGQDDNDSGGITPVGKAFLSLFILCLVCVICFFGYKYGYPNCKEQYTKRRNMNATEAETETTMEERRNPFVALYERFQRKVPSEVERPYSFVMSESKLDRNDHNVVISDTIESASTDGYGTEMILEDLQEQEERSSPSPPDRFTPNTLPQTKEYDAELGKQQNYSSVDEEGFPYSFDQQSFNDAFSFSDVNIIIDDSSSYASAGPHFLQASKRNYAVPDTVNL
jgi:hypothetical protein